MDGGTGRARIGQNGAMLLPLLLLSLAAAPQGPQRIPVLPLEHGDGISESTASALTDALAAELRTRPGLEIVTSKELAAVLGLSRQRELLGCEAPSCHAEVGGALDADLMIIGSLAKLGESWLLNVQLLDGRTARNVAQSKRRVKGGVDGLLDALPEMARELFPGGTRPAAQPTKARISQAAYAPAIPTADTFSPPWAEQRLPKGELDVSTMVFSTDGKGNYVGAVPTLSGKMVAGTTKGLFLQRVYGGGTDGKGGFDHSFWDPRGRNNSFTREGDRFSLRCGDISVPLQTVSAAQAKRLFAKTPVYDVRWQRVAHALARDEEGIYYFVDRLRNEKAEPDYRLYVGQRGKVSVYAAQLLASDAAGEIFQFGGSRLSVSARDGKAEIRHGETVRPLIFLDMERHASLAYGALGAYRGESLGTPCDGRF